MKTRSGFVSNSSSSSFVVGNIPREPRPEPILGMAIPYTETYEPVIPSNMWRYILWLAAAAAALSLVL